MVNFKDCNRVIFFFCLHSPWRGGVNNETRQICCDRRSKSNERYEYKT